jgi:hypothetical protein
MQGVVSFDRMLIRNHIHTFWQLIRRGEASEEDAGAVVSDGQVRATGAAQ